MSRVAKRPIKMPSGVSVIVDDRKVSVKGSKGTLACFLHPLVSID